ncbi:MAG TPA: hypothetical protein VFW07_09620 [Parafilimonas sp.]|nr:hypothetical protein [Parafilimonas sp.]
MRETEFRKSLIGTMRTSASVVIDAPNELITKIYLDYKNWDKLFPATIRGAKLIKEENGMQTIEVDHKKAGKVINLLRLLSFNEIKLKEFKPLYKAVFINRFLPIDGKTKYVVNAVISLKTIFKLLSPFLKSLVKNRIKNYVLYPMKKFAEKKYENSHNAG